MCQHEWIFHLIVWTQCILSFIAFGLFFVNFFSQQYGIFRYKLIYHFGPITTLRVLRVRSRLMILLINNCAIMVVEHFSHFPFVYAAKDYTAETVAKVLFKHYCHHGTFEQLASDPGSAFMSEVIRQLNRWLSIAHKVSLVGRHESNGTEGSNKQFLRHLRTLVMDERLEKSWSDDTVLPLINLHLASYPAEETGGYTPLQLKYGTEDAHYFSLPDQLELEPGARATRLIKQLDDNLQLIRTLSHGLQTKLAQERAKRDKHIST